MNYLNGKMVYLAGPIKQANDDGIGWREFITTELQKLNIIVSDPCKKTISKTEIGQDKKIFADLLSEEHFKDLKEAFWPIVRWDLRQVDKCDFVIFNYDPDVNTVGSIHELVVASFEKKPILLKYDKNQLNKFNPWIATFIKEKHFFSDWHSMINYLNDVNNGIFDTSYWVL